MYTLSCKESRFLPHIGAHVEFGMETGKTLVLVGKNGVGKSTLVHYFNQQCPHKISLIEQKALDPFYDRDLKRIKEIWKAVAGVNERRFDTLWRAFHFHQKENRLQSHLSGGESQALKLCLGLSIEKEIYILDEPTQYLDIEFKRILNSILVELLKGDKCLLLVEHDLDWMAGLRAEVTEVVTDEGVLQKGKTWII